MGGVGALAQPDRLLETAGPPGRLAEALQVVGRQAADLVRGPEEVVGVAPGVPPRGFPAGFQRFVEDLRHRCFQVYARSGP